MDRKLESFLFLVFFIMLLAPLSVEVTPDFRIHLFDFFFVLFCAWIFYCSINREDFSNSVPWLWLWLHGYLIMTTEIGVPGLALFILINLLPWLKLLGAMRHEGASLARETALQLVPQEAQA